MTQTLCIGNLALSVTEQDLAARFAQCGTVLSARIERDPSTGRSKGLGFVEMASDAETQTAINRLNFANHEGRPMSVNRWRPAK